MSQSFRGLVATTAWRRAANINFFNHTDSLSSFSKNSERAYFGDELKTRTPKRPKMKTLIASLLLLPTLAFAAKKETAKFTGTVSMHGLQCVTLVGRGIPAKDRTYTQLGNESMKLTIIHGPQTAFRLKHARATAAGCDLAKLDQISADSLQYYGFLYGAPIEVTRTWSDSWIVAQDRKCVADFREVVKINIGRGIVVESEEGGLVAMNDCR